MKIIFYIDKMKNGGAQRVMSILVNSFCANGHDTILINDATMISDDNEYYIDERVRRYFLLDSFNGNPISKNIKRIIYLRNIVKKERPDVILSFLGNCNIRMLLSTLKLKCKKIVSVRNAPDEEYGKRGVRKGTAKILFKLADGVVFQTEEAKNYFTKDVRKKSKIIFNPVHEDFFKVNRDETDTIVSLGRLERQKNHKLLIDAFADISDQIADNLYIYGEGPLRSELQKQIEERRLENRVFLAGITNDVSNVLSHAKLFVLPSNYEGMPNALLEAVASGTPSISTDCPCGGPKMIVDNGENGILVECGNAVQLKKAMKELILNKELRDNISKNAKESSKRFDRTLILQQWENYIMEVSESE